MDPFARGGCDEREKLEGLPEGDAVLSVEFDVALRPRPGDIGSRGDVTAAPLWLSELAERARGGKSTSSAA